MMTRTRMMTRRRFSQVYAEQKVSRPQARNVKFARTGRFHRGRPVRCVYAVSHGPAGQH
jgi:hypothetical protein